MVLTMANKSVAYTPAKPQKGKTATVRETKLPGNKPMPREPQLRPTTTKGPRRRG